MRILYVADGRYIHSYRWARYFTARNHEVHFVSFAPLNDEHRASLNGLGVVYHGELGGFHLKRFHVTAFGLWWLRSLLRRERIDVLHCHYLGVGAWYAALSGFHPLVLTIMGGGDVVGPDWRPEGGRARILTPFALRHADLVTSWSHQMVPPIRRYCRPGAPIEVIHGGVDLSRFRPGPKPETLRRRWNLPEDARVVFSPRLMRPLSNIDRIAEAALRVCAADPQAHFLFAAVPEVKDEAYERRVRDILSAEPARSRVRFVGKIAHDEMADYFRLADVTVSIAATDGTPMTVLESMACGTPVVVNDIPDYDGVYFEDRKSVLRARAEDVPRLSQAILTLLTDPALARALADEGQRRVEASGSYEAQMGHMESLYRRLVR